MKKRPDYGVFLLSIDVAPNAIQSDEINGVRTVSSIADRLFDGTKWLVKLLDEYALPATWFFAELNPRLRSQVASARTRHEIGVLVDSQIEQAGRREFARRLQRWILAAQAAGVDASSLALRTPGAIEHLDLFAKHGIRAVRQVALDARSSSHQSTWAAASSLRFGILNLPATIEIARKSWWRSFSNIRRIRQIRLAARSREYCHVTLDVSALADEGNRKAVRRILQHAARHFQTPQARIATVSAVAASLSPQPTAQTAHSILRAA